MDSTRLDLLATWTGGTLVAGDPTAQVSNVCTDSRSLRAGDLFFALKGEKFDGHDFVPGAAELGATAAVVEKVPAGLPGSFGVIVVPNVLKALQDVASHYRRTLTLKAIGITGSNGKTSTKDLIAGVLGTRFQVTKTEGNFNNHIGLPLTILRAKGSDEFGIFEIGMNHPGEIAPLAAIAAPDVAVITNIGIAHIEHMGSREAIAQEKGMLAEALQPGGFVVLNADDPFSPSIAARTKATAVYAGLNRGDVQAHQLRPHFNGVSFTLCADGREVEAELPVPGEHMVRNAVLAAAVGRVFGLTLEECAAGLQALKLTKGRLEQKLVRGIHILDDTYNANPDSMAAALRTLAQMPAQGRRIAVLGRMGELGPEAERGHRSVGEAAVQAGIDCLIGIGHEAHWITETAHTQGMARVLQCGNVEQAIENLREILREGDVVLVKGSRSARMERVVEGLQTV